MKKYTIVYHRPFYYLIELNRWWIFRYWSIVEFSYDLHEIELTCQKLKE